VQRHVMKLIGLLTLVEEKGSEYIPMWISYPVWSCAVLTCRSEQGSYHNNWVDVTALSSFAGCER
jgi:hypothetical protein